MFKELYLNNWRRIANTEYKPTIRYNRAALILKHLTKEAIQRKERGFYKVLSTVTP